MAIAALVTMTPKPGKRADLENALSEILEHVRAEPGNLVAMVLRDPARPELVIEFAVFRDEDAIKDHWAAEHSVRMEPMITSLQSQHYDARRFETVGWPTSKLVASE